MTVTVFTAQRCLRLEIVYGRLGKYFFCDLLQLFSFLKFIYFSLLEEINFLPIPLVLFKDQINLVFKAQKSEAVRYKGQFKLPIAIAVAEICHS